MQSLAEAKGLGKSMNCSFMRTVRSGTVESFCIRTQKQRGNEMALLQERDSILQGMLTVLALWIICLSIINYVRLLLAVGHSNNNGFYMHLRAIIGRTPKFRAFAWTKPHSIINNTQNSLQTCAWTSTFAVPERTNWKDKKLDEIDARNIGTSL